MNSIPVTGGELVFKHGAWFFILDMDSTRRISPDANIPLELLARIMWSNPTPVFLPMLGGFMDPQKGGYVQLEIPEAWQRAWQKAPTATGMGRYVTREELLAATPKSHLSTMGAISPGGGAPYYRQSAGPDTGMKCVTEGPFNTLEEAMAAPLKTGAQQMPLDGWAQYKDRNGSPVGPVT